MAIDQHRSFLPASGCRSTTGPPATANVVDHSISLASTKKRKKNDVRSSKGDDWQLIRHVTSRRPGPTGGTFSNKHTGLVNESTGHVTRCLVILFSCFWLGRRSFLRRRSRLATSSEMRSAHSAGSGQPCCQRRSNSPQATS